MRRYQRLLDEEELDMASQRDERSLDGSINGDGDLFNDSLVSGLEDESFASAKEGRVALTVWSTSTSAYTYTSTSINSSTTMSISYWCSVDGMSYPPACG